jgi:hypothetical protein
VFHPLNAGNTSITCPSKVSRCNRSRRLSAFDAASPIH